MKKILRLVTTSVLTLTLVACGEASSSVSNGTNTSSSVSSVSSAYANVTSVTLSAATATLTQVTGSQKRVSVTASLNANTNPNLALEWYVNGVKQAQTGRIFDFTPTEVGSFAITAKVGNVASNTLTVNLGLPTLSITSTKFVEANQLELVASPGAVVSLVGAELDDSSYYDLKNGKYVLNLKKDLVQGASVTVSLERAGFTKLTQAVVYDTRVFLLDEVNLTVPELATATELVAEGGVFKIVRPFDAGEQYNKKYSVSFESENLSSSEYKTEVSVPTGAAVIPSSSEIVDSPSTKEFVITSLTTLGLYTHKFTFGTKVVEVKVEVVEAKPTVDLITDETWVANNYPVGGAFNEYQLSFGLDDNKDKAFDTPSEVKYLAPSNDGSYTIVRPLETFGTKEYLLTFGFVAKNFTKPEFINNQWNIEIAGPSSLSTTVGTLFSGIETTSSSANTTNVTDHNLKNFNGAASTTGGSVNTSAVTDVYQFIDSTSPLGTYTFKITAGTTGNLVTKNVVVNLVAPTPVLDFNLVSFTSFASPVTRVLEVNQISNTYVIEKPLDSTATYKLQWITTLMNYQSRALTSSQFDEVTADSLFANTDDKKLFNAATGIATASDYQAANLLVKQGLTTAVTVKAKVTATATTIDVNVGNGNVAVTTTGLTLTPAEDFTAVVGQEYDLVLGTVSTTAIATLNATDSFDITGATLVDGGGSTFNVKVSNYPDVIELGSGADITGTTNYRFVNLGMTATGPSNLFESYPLRRAAITLAADKNGIILFNQTGPTAGTDGASFTQAQAIAAGSSKDLLLDTASNVHDDQDDFDDNNGLNRTTLDIKNTTVEGTYTLRFVVDNLVEEVKIQIVPSKARIFVKSLWEDAGVINKFEPTEGNQGNKFDSSVELLKFYDDDGVAADYDTDDAANKFVIGINGVYNIETSVATTATKDVIYGKVLVTDLAVGTYSYVITKEFPDGRVERYSDSVKVTAIDANQIATFDANNSQFINNWTINQQYNTTKEGTYKFTFSVAGVSKVYTINIVNPPSMVVEELTISRKEATLFNGIYRALTTELVGAVRAKVSLENLTEDDFVVVYIDTDNLANLTVAGIDQGATFGAGSLLETNAKLSAAMISLKGLEYLDLGTLSGATTSATVQYTLHFYRKTVKVTSNPANELGFDLIGVQVIKVQQDA
jgi:hypothetical protein